MMKNFIFTFIMLLLAIQIVRAEVIFDTHVDKALATTSEEIIFTLNLTRPESINLSIPDIGDKIEGFRIVDFGENKPEKMEDHVRLQRWYKRNADVSGVYILPSVEIGYTDKNGKNHTIKSSEIFVEFESPYSKEKKEKGVTPKDIRDIKDLDRMSSSLILLFVIILVCLILGAGVWFFIKRKNRKTAMISIPPHEKALNELAGMKMNDLETREKSRMFSFKLSSVIRDYVEGRFNFPATDRTIEEINKQINNVQMEQERKKIFLEILQKTDFIKFTDSVLSNDSGKELVENSRKFIEQTMIATKTRSSDEGDLI